MVFPLSKNERMLKKSSPSLLQALNGPPEALNKNGVRVPALALRWAYVRTGSAGARRVGLVKDRSETGQHQLQTSARRSTEAKARRFLQHPSPFGRAGKEGAAFSSRVKARAAARGPRWCYFQLSWLRTEGRRTSGTRHGAVSHMQLRNKSQATAR